MACDTPITLTGPTRQPRQTLGSDDKPWGRVVVPIEMISVLDQKVGTEFPVRGPSVGLAGFVGELRAEVAEPTQR